MFAVIWKRRALDQLADLYVAIDPPDRAALTELVAGLNARLATDPRNEGESKPGGYRLGHAGRYAVTFVVEPDVDVVPVTRF